VATSKVTFTSSRWPGLAVTVGSRVMRFDGNKYEAGEEDAKLMRIWIKMHPNAGVAEQGNQPASTPAPDAPKGPSLDMTRAQLADLVIEAGGHPGKRNKAELLGLLEELGHEEPTGDTGEAEGHSDPSADADGQEDTTETSPEGTGEES